MSERLELYRRLFVHRDDVYAAQQPNGAYNPVRGFLTDSDLAAHLDGLRSFGVYVIAPEGVCVNAGDVDGPQYGPLQSVRYVVFDLDTYDADALDFLCRAVVRLLLQTAPQYRLEDLFRCLLLEDSGGKGYHVWLFLSEPVTAVKARAWAEALRPQYHAASRTAVGGSWPALEIFPKQDEVAPGGFGNLVKLPLGRHAVTHAWSMFKPRPGWANAIEDVVPFDVALIPEPAAEAPRLATQGEAVAPFACIAKILTDGAGSGNRDNALYHFARYALSCGVPPDLCEDWAVRVNEQFDPPLSTVEVRTKVRSAARAHTANPGCTAEWLRGFCPGGPRCFAPWNHERAGKDSAAPAYSNDWLRRARGE